MIQIPWKFSKSRESKTIFIQSPIRSIQWKFQWTEFSQTRSECEKLTLIAATTHLVHFHLNRQRWSEIICIHSSIMHRLDPFLLEDDYRVASKQNSNSISRHVTISHLMSAKQSSKHTFRCPCQGPSKWTAAQMKAPCTRPLLTFQVAKKRESQSRLWELKKY